MSWSKIIGQMALCLIAPLIALFSLYPLMSLPIRRDDNNYIAVVAALAFFLFWSSIAGRGLRRGTLLFCYALCFALVMTLSVMITHVIHILFFVDLRDAIRLVFFAMLTTIAGLLLLRFVCGGQDDNTRTVEVQRGRQRYEAAPSFLYVDTQSMAAPKPTTDRVYDSEFDDLRSPFVDLVDQEFNDFFDDDPEVYKAFCDFKGEVPESEFDENFTYDVRRPTRLPLKKDSILRKHFELQARTKK